MTVTTIGSTNKIDAATLRQQAEAEVAKEVADKARLALKTKLRDLQRAQSIVANLEREVDDLEASIADGSFV